MYKEQHLKDRFINPSGQVKRKAVAAYQRHVERFQELWLALKMLLSQPLVAISRSSIGICHGR
jgi:hypothetical protein